MSNIVQPATLRQDRRRETRDEIRRIALALVEGRGYEEVTVDLISARAGVSVRTFFNYFPNKESAMIAMPPAVPWPAVQEFLSRTGRQGLLVELADLAVRMFAEGGSAPADFESAIQIVMGVPSLATLQQGALLEWETEFVELIAERLNLDPGDVEPAVIAAAFTGAIRVACKHWSRSPDRRTFPEEVRACVTLLLVAAAGGTGGVPVVTPAERHR